MYPRKLNWTRKGNFLAGVLALIFMISGAALTAPPDQVLYNFTRTPGSDRFPTGLTRDGAGNLYGVTRYGLAGQAGGVFELSPQQGGGWTYTMLHKFKFQTSDGAYPSGSPIMDAEGNLYGVTENGGGADACPDGCGTVYELSPNRNGGWSEKVLHSFQGSDTDGFNPTGPLAFDSGGNLYGTTSHGGVGDGDLAGGTVYELSPQSGTAWKETILITFIASSQQGYGPFGGVILDSLGNLYGTTYGGGSDPSCSGGYNGCGSVFELSASDGGWTEQILHNFLNNGIDGIWPDGTLAFDNSGNLYGTTSAGGTGYVDAYYGGTIFELSPQIGGLWKETVLHNFQNNGQDGAIPDGGPILDSAGNLYGATQIGGTHLTGTAFELITAKRKLDRKDPP